MRVNELDEFELAFSRAATNRALELVILPTEQCNFRCVYCYEDFAVGRMSAATVAAVKQLLARRLSDLDCVSINWFGGEPLLGLPVVLDISGYLSSYAASNPSLDYTAAMTTNGYRLDPDTAAALVEVGVRHFQVSLDGPAELHDRVRRRINGAATFAPIWTNLLALRDSNLNLEVTIRLHLTPDNADALDQFAVALRDTFLADPRFSVLLMPVAKLGGPNDGTFDVLAPGETLPVIRHVRRLLEPGNLPPGEEHDGPEVASMQAADVCYASKPNSLVIRADGRLAKCTVGFEDPWNQIGQLRPDGTLEVTQERFAGWLAGWQTGRWEDLSCPRDAFFLEPDAGRVPVLLSPTRSGGR